MRHTYHLMQMALLMLGLTAGLAACSDETGGSGGSGGGSSSSSGGVDAGKDAAPAATEGSIAGKVTYTGAEKGALVVTAFSMVMSEGPPIIPSGMPSSIATNETAVWPGDASYEIKKLKPGDYYVLAYISIGSIHMQPAGKDPRGAYTDMMGKGQKITVKAGEATMAPTFKLNDLPPPGDGGTDGGDGGP